MWKTMPGILRDWSKIAIKLTRTFKTNLRYFLWCWDSNNSCFAGHFGINMREIRKSLLHIKDDSKVHSILIQKFSFFLYIMTKRRIRSPGNLQQIWSVRVGPHLETASCVSRFGH
jgi:hypothetical protein